MRGCSRSGLLEWSLNLGGEGVGWSGARGGKSFGSDASTRVTRTWGRPSRLALLCPKHACAGGRGGGARDYEGDGNTCHPPIAWPPDRVKSMNIWTNLVPYSCGEKIVPHCL